MTSSATARHTRVIAGAVIVVALGAITAGCGGNKTTNPSTTTTPSTTTASTTAPAPPAPSPSGPAPTQNNINPTGGNQFTPVAPAAPPTAQYPHTRSP